MPPTGSYLDQGVCSECHQRLDNVPGFFVRTGHVRECPTLEREKFETTRGWRDCGAGVWSRCLPAYSLLDGLGPSSGSIMGFHVRDFTKAHPNIAIRQVVIVPGSKEILLVTEMKS